MFRFCSEFGDIQTLGFFFKISYRKPSFKRHCEKAIISIPSEYKIGPWICHDTCFNEKSVENAHKWCYCRKMFKTITMSNLFARNVNNTQFYTHEANAFQNQIEMNWRWFYCTFAEGNFVCSLQKRVCFYYGRTSTLELCNEYSMEFINCYY